MQVLKRIDVIKNPFSLHKLRTGKVVSSSASRIVTNKLTEACPYSLNARKNVRRPRNGSLELISLNVDILGGHNARLSRNMDGGENSPETAKSFGNQQFSHQVTVSLFSPSSAVQSVTKIRLFFAF